MIIDLSGRKNKQKYSWMKLIKFNKKQNYINL